MDLQAWLPSFITGAFAFLGVVFTAKKSREKTIEEMKNTQEKQNIIVENQISEIKKDINRLEEKQDKHNGIIERVYKLEQNDAVILQRINDMDGAGKKRAGA